MAFSQSRAPRQGSGDELRLRLRPMTGPLSLLTLASIPSDFQKEKLSTALNAALRRYPKNLLATMARALSSLQRRRPGLPRSIVRFLRRIFSPFRRRVLTSSSSRLASTRPPQVAPDGRLAFVSGARSLESVRVQARAVAEIYTLERLLRARMAIRRSWVARSAARLYFSLLTTQATRGGSNATIAFQEIAMPLAQLLG